MGNISHWPVSHITSFANMFKGCESLYVVDIHNWQMGPVNAVNRTDMLSGCKSLKTLILNGTVSLRDSGLDDLAATDTRGPSHGSWLRIIDKTENTPYTADPWYGSSANLVKRYSDSTNTHGMGDGEGAIYIWTDVLRGRFEDNDNAWWHYDSSRKILTMGLDEPEAGETYTDADREVTALPSWLGNTSVAALPWEVAFPNIKNECVNAYAVLNGVSSFKLRPTTMHGWFKDYTALTNFDGSNYDTTIMCGSSASLDDLFNGCGALKTLDLSNWHWSDRQNPTTVPGAASYDNMLLGLNSLISITLEADAALAGTGLDDRTATADRIETEGRWVMDNVTTGAGAADIAWFDCTEKLVARYPGDTPGVVLQRPLMSPTSPQVVVNYLQGRHTYTWDSKVLGGRFEDNPNAWWTFNVEETYNTPAGTLKAGTDNQNPVVDIANNVYGLDVWADGDAIDNGDGTWTYDTSRLRGPRPSATSRA